MEESKEISISQADSNIDPFIENEMEASPRKPKDQEDEATTSYDLLRRALI